MHTSTSASPTKTTIDDLHTHEPVPISTPGAAATDDHGQLNSRKRSWLHQLPLEQVIEIVLKLDEHAPVTVRHSIWPTDILGMEPVNNADKEKEKEGSAAGTYVVAENAGTDGGQKADGRTMNGTAEEVVEISPSNESSRLAPAASSTPPASSTPAAATNPPPAAGTAPALPPAAPLMASLQPPSSSTVPTPSTTSFIPTLPPPGPVPYTFAYPSYAGSSYTHAHSNVNQQSYQSQVLALHSRIPSAHPSPYIYGAPNPATSSPALGQGPSAFPSSPLPRSTPPASSMPIDPALMAASPPGVRDSPTPVFPMHALAAGQTQDDLPSYEEMLVQALTELASTDPSIAENGAVPKVLFRWMAKHYPLQQNFRPSASQALQKAFKRGRFEKQLDGKYKLNMNWSGGATAKRTTRRPQTQAQAETNPHPSSHQPPIGQGHHPPGWPTPGGPPYAQGVGPRPAFQEGQAQPPMAGLHPAPGDRSDADGNGNGLGENENSSVMHGMEDHDPETAREAWEAAQSILQALNIGSLLRQATSSAPGPTETNTDTSLSGATAADTSQPAAPPSVTATPAPSSFPPPIFASSVALPFASSSSGGSQQTGAGGLALPVSSSASIFSTPLLPQPLAANAASSSASTSPATAPVPPKSTDGSLTVGSTPGYAQKAGLGSGRASLQGSLALLAAQLADFAGAGDSAESGPSTGLPSSAVQHIQPAPSADVGHTATGLVQAHPLVAHGLPIGVGS